jgi:hypothetical protein
MVYRVADGPAIFESFGGIRTATRPALFHLKKALSTRRTEATLFQRRIKNLRAVQLLPGHRKLESIVRYLGIEVDDALEMAEVTEMLI